MIISSNENVLVHTQFYSFRDNKRTCIPVGCHCKSGRSASTLLSKHRPHHRTESGRDCSYYLVTPWDEMAILVVGSLQLLQGQPGAGVGGGKAGATDIVGGDFFPGSCKGRVTLLPFLMGTAVAVRLQPWAGTWLHLGLWVWQWLTLTL